MSADLMKLPAETPGVGAAAGVPPRGEKAPPGLAVDPGATPTELVASPYVESARRRFQGSPAGARVFGSVVVRAPLPGKYGQQANSTGRPIGGGPTYGDWVATTGGFVRTLTELEAALGDHLRTVQAAIAANTPFPRLTIFLAGDVNMEIGATTLVIPPGVTLASSRGRNRSPGALIKSSSDTKGVSFVILSREALGTTRPLPPVRITGLRFEGPNSHEDPPDFLDCSSDGRIAVQASEPGSRDDASKIVDRVIEIDNNEFSSWPVAALDLSGIRGGYVHHNHIHHSQRNAHSIRCALTFQLHAVGYGVAVNNGLVYIEGNIFAMNRHHIASRGDRYTDYVAMYNDLGPEGPSHHFDVHGGEDREDGTHIAARNIIIAYNTDSGTGEDAVNVRGNPVLGAWITGNQFAGCPNAIRQTKTGSGAGLTIWDNKFACGQTSSGSPDPGGGSHPGDPPMQQK